MVKLDELWTTEASNPREILADLTLSSYSIILFFSGSLFSMQTILIYDVTYLPLVDKNCACLDLSFSGRDMQRPDHINRRSQFSISLSMGHWTNSITRENVNAKNPKYNVSYKRKLIS